MRPGEAGAFFLRAQGRQERFPARPGGWACGDTESAKVRDGWPVFVGFRKVSGTCAEKDWPWGRLELVTGGHVVTPSLHKFVTDGPYLLDLETGRPKGPYTICTIVSARHIQGPGI